MYDLYNRKIDYLRISVTDRCNLRCAYCMPCDGVKWLKHEDILSYEEITEITAYLVKQGIRKVRLTGGEPLVRKDIATLVAMISAIEGIDDLSMTTNGILLPVMAMELKKAGLNRVNISLDTLDPDIYQAITSEGRLENVINGIQATIDAGLSPVKINCVDGTYNSTEDIANVKAFGREKGIPVRIIRQMNLESGTFTVVEGGTGGKCDSCNRIRLSSDGKLKPCLFSNLEYDVRSLGIEKALQLALNNKPARGISNLKNTFNQTGG